MAGLLLAWYGYLIGQDESFNKDNKIAIKTKGDL
jgi:hypothetical protein